ncbi:MAG: histidine--tRNA ligase [Agromyces sp.]
MASVTPPRGMRDFLPVEKARREQVLSIIRASYLGQGFDEIETPVMEDASRLHSGLGGDNEKLAFAVMKRGLSSDDLRAAADSDDALSLADLGLRFDLTVPLARFYASHRAELPPVFRAIQIAPVWRAERPQKGRFRQFVQCDIDIIGEAGQLAELELLSATTATLAALGLTGCTIRINDRRILTGLLHSWGVPAEAHGRVLITIDKLDKLGPTGVAEELASLDVAPTFADTSNIATTLTELGAADWSLLAAAPSWLDQAAYQDLLAIRSALPGSILEFDPTLVRGMGYYTGTIFEIAHPEVPYSLGGGGRYDGMIGRFLGQDVPACGFSIGFERIVDLVELSGSVSAESAAVLFEPGEDPARLIQLKSALSQQELRIRLEPRAKNQRAQLDRLASEGFTRFAVLTPGAPADAATLEFRDLS